MESIEQGLLQRGGEGGGGGGVCVCVGGVGGGGGGTSRLESVWYFSRMATFYGKYNRCFPRNRFSLVFFVFPLCTQKPCWKARVDGLVQNRWFYSYSKNTQTFSTMMMFH